MNAQGATIRVPEPMQPIPASIEQLQRAVSRMEETAGILRDRLHRVLRPEGKGTDGSAKGLAEVQANSQVVEQINSEAAKVDRITAGLDDLIARLEA